MTVCEYKGAAIHLFNKDMAKPFNYWVILSSHRSGECMAHTDNITQISDTLDHLVLEISNYVKRNCTVWPEMNNSRFTSEKNTCKVIKRDYSSCLKLSISFLYVALPPDPVKTTLQFQIKYFAVT